MPGGNTGCLLGDYVFRVWRGNSSKVLLTFDGGGSCWNWPTFVGAMCSPAVGFNWAGIMKIQDPGNPFYGYTLVEVVYCSGDAFAGASEHFWIMPAQSASAWKPMKGYANTLSVMEWTKAQFEGPEPGLTSPLESFVISGESAGALGVQLWQAAILERFKGRYQDKKTIFIADSFLGLQVKSSKKSGNMTRTSRPDHFATRSVYYKCLIIIFPPNSCHIFVGKFVNPSCSDTSRYQFGHHSRQYLW